jgi:nicotinamide mononucleotide (NMN) deamidase PncC
MAVPGGPTMLSEALVSCDAMVIARWLGLSDPSASLRAEALKAEDSEHRIVLDPPSPEVATRLAESLRSITAADVALALVGTLVGDPYAEHTGITHAALALPGETKQDQFRLGGTSVLVQNWVTNLALDFVRRAI